MRAAVVTADVPRRVGGAFPARPLSTAPVASLVGRPALDVRGVSGAPLFRAVAPAPPQPCQCKKRLAPHRRCRAGVGCFKFHPPTATRARLLWRYRGPRAPGDKKVADGLSVGRRGAEFHQGPSRQYVWNRHFTGREGYWKRCVVARVMPADACGRVGPLQLFPRSPITSVRNCHRCRFLKFRSLGAAVRPLSSSPVLVARGALCSRNSHRDGPWRAVPCWGPAPQSLL